MSPVEAQYWDTDGVTDPAKYWKPGLFRSVQFSPSCLSKQNRTWRSPQQRPTENTGAGIALVGSLSTPLRYIRPRRTAGHQNSHKKYGERILHSRELGHNISNLIQRNNGCSHHSVYPLRWRSSKQVRKWNTTKWWPIPSTRVSRTTRWTINRTNNKQSRGQKKYCQITMDINTAIE